MKIILNLTLSSSKKDDSLDNVVNIIKEALLEVLNSTNNATIQLHSLIEKVEINTLPCCEYGQRCRCLGSRC